MKNKFYSFSGKDEEGKPIHGIVDAASKALARLTLLKIGLTHINYIIISISSYKSILFLGDKEKLQLLSHINLQISAGISIFNSIESIKLDSNVFKFKYLMFLILKNLNEGHKFSTALVKIPYNSFNITETELIKASEISGTMDSTLQFICKRLEKKLFIRQKIISALIYPCITIIISFVVIFIILKWVAPQFEIIFLQSKHSLPLLTKFIFSISKNIGKILSLTLTTMLLLAVILKLLIKNYIFSHKLIEKFLLKIPIWGKTLLLTNRINFCYTLAMLLKAGVSLHDALIKASELITLTHSKYNLKQATIELVAGRKLSTSLKKMHFFSRTAIQAITTAESTGRLDQAFEMLGQQFSNDFSVFSDQIEKIIEPMIIIFLGCVIGTIVIAIYLPIFQLGSLY